MQKTFTVVASSTRARWPGPYKLCEKEMRVPECHTLMTPRTDGKGSVQEAGRAIAERAPQPEHLPAAWKAVLKD